ncbi:hypothetical protein CRG98_034055 [Punica granatum]|uniref:Uncharacterized protein n=1 Tax=Punica granatum TaxID=22663 RepID=A0A2I0INH7_PUNGR|nr:hypothetical protein CRG98_034055 [Punica granatum]
MDRWASGHGWAGPNANGPPLLDWAGPLLDWAVTARPCRKLGCSRPLTPHGHGLGFVAVQE